MDQRECMFCWFFIDWIFAYTVRFRWAVCQLDYLQRLKFYRHIINNALKTLPKTLDETYERISMEVSKDEWPFARNALQWICFHQDLYNGFYPMSLQVLLAATERSTCKEVHQESDFEYNEERLHNMLGCLIKVDKDNTVFLAHYTVKEYLESQRISQRATGYFSTGQEVMIKECIRTIFQEAQAIDLHDWPDAKAELLSQPHCYFSSDTPDLFLQDFAVYCVVSSSKLLHTKQNVIALDKLLLSLVVDFVNPALTHFDSIVRLNDCFEQWGFFVDHLYPVDGEWFFPSWNVQPDCVETGILLNLLCISCYSDFPILADAFLDGKDILSIAKSNVNFRKVEPTAGQSRMYDFDGSLLEVMAQLYPRPFLWLLDQCDTLMDTRLLLAVIGCR